MKRIMVISLETISREKLI